MTATGEPFQPLMSEGGRPPPGASGDFMFPGLNDSMVKFQAEETGNTACRCAPMKCPGGGDEALPCQQIYSARCSLLCGNAQATKTVSYGGSTMLIITQLVTPSST